MSNNEIGFLNEYPDIYVEVKSVEKLMFGSRFVNSLSYRLELCFRGGKTSSIAKLQEYLRKCYCEKVLMEDVLPFGPDEIMIAFRGHIESIGLCFNGRYRNDSLEVYVEVSENDIVNLTPFFNQKNISPPVYNF